MMATTSAFELDDQLFYSRNIELSIALREVDREYYISPKQWFSSYNHVVDQYVAVFWKPPGALQWVEKFETEKAPGCDLSVEFVTKAFIDVEEQDLNATPLKFEIFGQQGTRWSSIETNLGRIVSGGIHGVQLALQLDLPYIPAYLASKQSDTVPGFIHLRAEFVNSPAKDTLGVKLSMVPKQKGSNYSLRSKYVLELHKLNVANKLDHLLHPYTVLYRDYLEFDKQRLREFEPFPFYTNESRITNGEMDRVMKIVICKRKNGKKKGFALFTLSDLIRKPCQYLSVNGVNGSVLEEIIIEICLNLFQNLKTLSHYLEFKLQFFRVYAVDFSGSNWDGKKHGESLHSNNTSIASPYVEALEMVSYTMAHLSDGESVFYSFGGEDGTDLVSTFGNENHTKRLIEIYQDSVYSFLFKNMQLRDKPEDEYRDSSSEYTSIKNNMQHGDESAGAGPSHLFSCVPQSCKMQSHFKNCKQNLLAPLLQDIKALLSTRPNNALEYFTVFILTDGDFCDMKKAAEMLIELSEKPVSLIFVGIGNGDLSSLIDLDKSSYRKNMHLVHFRSSLQWQSSLSFYKIQSHPNEIFRKEILTAVRDQSVAYWRQHRPRI